MSLPLLFCQLTKLTFRSFTFMILHETRPRHSDSDTHIITSLNQHLIYREDLRMSLYHPLVIWIISCFKSNLMSHTYKTSFLTIETSSFYFNPSSYSR
jgi:hypothetical protein